MRAVQPGREVHRPGRFRPRARRGLPRDRSLCAPRGQRWPGRASQGRRSAPRPELFPLRDDARAARFPALSASAICPRTRCGGSPPRLGSKSRPSPTARTSASSRTAIMPALVKRMRPETEAAGRDRRSRRPGARPASRRRPFHRRPAPRDRDRRPAASRCTSSGSNPSTRRHGGRTAARARGRSDARRASGTGSARSSARSA